MYTGGCETQDTVPGSMPVSSTSSRTSSAGEPAEIAAAIVFPASDEPSFVNGSTLQADRGLHAV